MMAVSLGAIGGLSAILVIQIYRKYGSNR